VPPRDLRFLAVPDPVLVRPLQGSSKSAMRRAQQRRAAGR